MSDPRIFICYRHEDDDTRTRRLYDRLSREFGADEVFMDEITVRPGAPVRESITEQLRRCEVLLVVIGPRWLTVQEPDGGRRIDHDLDFVRLEIESALAGSAAIVPLLVDNARMPPARELPGPIAGLADRAALELSDGRNWEADTDRLIATIRERLPPRSPQPLLAAAPLAHGPRWTVRPAVMLAAACVLLIVGAIAVVVLIVDGDDRLRIYSSLPERDGEGNPSKRVSDMEKAMRLALKQEHGKAGDREVVYEPLDASDAGGDTPEPLIEANAKQAADDDRTAAYLGDFNSGDSQLSIPILNEAGIAQISPASTRTGLTAHDERGDLGEPEDYYPRRYRNFARVIPNDIVQAKALLELMLSPRPRPCTRLAVVDDASPYGRGLSNDILAFNDGRLQIKFRQSVDENGAFQYLVDQAVHRGVDCFVFSGVKREHTVEMFEAFAGALDGARLFGTDGLADRAFYAASDWSSDAVAGRVSIMVPPRSSTRYAAFRDAFVAEYGAEPELYAVYGYEAMLVALDAIEASKTGSREDVVQALFDMPRRRSALGSYRFDEQGDTTLGRYAWSTIADGELTTPRPTPPIDR
jgi:branched-chain amino acid transport system substrate-binding protein